jgi:hypothetical protein
MMALALVVHSASQEESVSGREGISPELNVIFQEIVVHR